MMASEHAAARALDSQESFEACYVRTAPALRAYLHRLTGDLALADDLLQESYIRLLAAPPRDAVTLKPYLYRIATNLVIDHSRRRRRELSFLAGLLRPNGTASPPLDLASDVERLFARLKLRERSLLWLAYVEGANHHEIAAVLSLHEKSVRTLLGRARRKWEQILAAHDYRGKEHP